jgi:thiamine-phosphate pyrophosphorylase
MADRRFRKVARAMPAEAPRLYLITPPISERAFRLPLSGEEMTACGVACMLLRTAALGDAENELIFRALAPPLQERGIACLVADDPQLCVRVNADGVHTNGEGLQLERALRALKPKFIVGAGQVWTRHGAMIAGEAGADYVMFGESGEPYSDVVERVAWWAEIFTVPCVAYASDLESIGNLVRAGADFIALGRAVFSDPRGADAALHEAAARVTLLPEATQ